MEEEKVMETLVGKTISGVARTRVKERPDYDVLKVVFTDGTFVELESWDFEGYESGITIGDVEIVAERER